MEALKQSDHTIFATMSSEWASPDLSRPVGALAATVSEDHGWVDQLGVLAPARG